MGGHVASSKWVHAGVAECCYSREVRGLLVVRAEVPTSPVRVLFFVKTLLPAKRTSGDKLMQGHGPVAVNYA
jgi:hypothetical protein